jgi:quercetin dioxygenase-like cupin family protein
MLNAFQLLAEGLDAQPALDALSHHPALWDVMTERQDFPGSPHAATRCIVVRGPTELTPEAAFNEIPAVPYMPAFQLLSGAIAPLIGELAFRAAIAGGDPFGRVMVVELAPHAHVSAHRDEGAYAKHYSRFHIVLSGECAFTCGEDTVRMSPGEIWWFDHRQVHEVWNPKAEPRIHLIVDAVSPYFEVDQQGA